MAGAIASAGRPDFRGGAARIAAALLAATALSAARQTPAVAPSRVAPAAAGLSARALLDSVCANYLGLARFQFEGRLHVSFRSDTGALANSFDTPFRYCAVRPGKLLNEVVNPYMGSICVADGDSLYLYVPQLHQYTVQPAPSILPGTPVTDDYQRTLNPTSGIATLAQGVSSVRDAGIDTVRQSEGPVRCRRLVLEYAADSTRPNVTLDPRVLWVDEARRLIARDSVTARVRDPRVGPTTTVQDTRFVLARTADGGSELFYHFAPPDDARRVERIGAPGLQEPDRTGQVAPPFSLATLAGPRVSLASLKGRIVVLDFWATWCGPCRRWMPIVAKLERELAPRGVKFYAVNLRESRQQIRAYLTRTRVSIPVLLDSDASVGGAYGASAIPLTVIVGRDGRIVRTLTGVHEESELRDALRAAGAPGL